MKSIRTSYTEFEYFMWFSAFKRGDREHMNRSPVMSMLDFSDILKVHFLKIFIQIYLT